MKQQHKKINEPIKDKKNTFTLINRLKSADKTHTKVLIFSTLGKKGDKDLIRAYKSRLFGDDVLIYSVISAETMEFLKEYIDDLEKEIAVQAFLLAEYEAEQ